jgi:hypothetical protein
MGKKYCLALVILLIACTGIANLAIGYKPTITPNTNYRSSYLPNPSYNSFTPPTQLGGSSNPQSVQLSPSLNTITNVTNQVAASFSVLVQEEFRVVGDSNEPIPNARVAGLDGSSNSFQESTDNNGYVAINGSSGNWQFTVYAPGYFTQSVNRKFEYNADVVLILQKIGDQEELNEDQIENKFTRTNAIVNETTHEIIPNWLCGSNGDFEQDSDKATDQSIDTESKG